MKRFLIAAASLATLVAPMAASAQSWGDVHRDKREVREDRQRYEQDRAHAHSNGRVNHYERRELRDDRRELRQDRQDLRQSRFDRNNRNWWRGRSDFNGYNGRHAGYWYAPGYGYRQVDGRFANYGWHRGGYVPAGYRSYYVQDPGFYGLRAAPYGYRWVYVDNNLVLMSVASGLIADIVAGAY